MKNIALITGITGQDGLYLTEQLLAKDYQIIGIVRNIKDKKKPAFLSSNNNIQLVEWNMLEQDTILDILREYQPSEIYNFAAYSSGSGMFDSPVNIGEINGLAVTRILDAIREVNVKIKFCQASSREIFGEASESPQTESTKINPRSPYGAAKLYADTMIKIYREHYNMFACSAILYNHESPRRGLNFVTRKITNTAARIKLGLEKELLLGNLDAQRDWGFAGDTVNAMWLMLQQKHADDYIIATGEVHTVREFCEYAFSYLGLDYREHVREDINSYRPVEPIKLIGDANKARKRLGWNTKVKFEELIYLMVDADMQLLQN